MLPEKIEHTCLWRMKAKDFPIQKEFGLYLEEPMEDVNNQDGRCIEKQEDKIVFRFGSWIERQEFDPEEYVVITWFDWNE